MTPSLTNSISFFLPTHKLTSRLFPVYIIKPTSLSLSLSLSQLTRFSFQYLMGPDGFTLNRRITHGIAWTVLLCFLFHSSAAQPVTQQPPDRDPNRLYTTFEPSVAILILVLVTAFLLISLFSIYVRHCADYSPAAATVLPSRAAACDARLGLDPAVIESFPIFVYSAVKEHKIGKGALECAVCLSEFEDDDTLRLLPKCDHVFHPDCIGAWLASHLTCPVCRAKLTPEESDQTAKATPESSNESTHSQSRGNPTSERNATVIDINDGENGEAQVHETDNASHVTPKKNGSPRRRICGKFPRSHSTGHSIVQGGVDIERYTLRLPEEVRRQIVMSGKIKRAQSFNEVLGAEGNSRKCGGGGDGSSRGRSYVADRWVLSKTPPFVSRISSSAKVGGGGGGGGEGDGSVGRSLLTAVKSPLNCLNVKVDGAESSSVKRPQV